MERRRDWKSRPCGRRSPGGCGLLILVLGPCLWALGSAAPESERQEPLIGWASVDGGTTGGQGGPTVVAKDARSFLEHVRGDDPVVVQVSGTIRLRGSVRVGSNKTVLGLGADAVITGGGLNLRRVHNVIVRNLAIEGSPDDAVNIEGSSHHVWLDHCEFSRCGDGLVDIKGGSDLITVSWNHFHDHVKTCLLGHSDRPTALAGDEGRLRVTYHHNFFDGTNSRHPRARTGSPVHVFNNYFRNNDHGVAATMDAGVLVEANYFERVERPTHTHYGASPDPGRLQERDNIYVDCKSKPQVRGTVAEPGRFYTYTPDRAADVPELVRRGAGVGQIGL